MEAAIPARDERPRATKLNTTIGSTTRTAAHVTTTTGTATRLASSRRDDRDRYRDDGGGRRDDRGGRRTNSDREPRTGKQLFGWAKDHDELEWFSAFGKNNRFPAKFNDWDDRDVADAMRAYGGRRTTASSNGNGEALIMAMIGDPMRCGQCAARPGRVIFSATSLTHRKHLRIGQLQEERITEVEPVSMGAGRASWISSHGARSSSAGPRNVISTSGSTASAETWASTST